MPQDATCYKYHTVKTSLSLCYFTDKTTFLKKHESQLQEPSQPLSY